MKTAFLRGAELLKRHGATSVGSNALGRGRRIALRNSTLFGPMLLLALSILLTVSPHVSAQENASPTAASHARPEAELAPASSPGKPECAEITDYYCYGKLGFIDRSGKVVIKPAFDRAGDFAANGLAPVAIHSRTQDDPTPIKWGYINAKGSVVIPLQFWKAEEFGDNGLAAVLRYDNTLDFIDADGRFRTSLPFQDLLAGRGPHGASLPVAFSHLLAPAKWNGKWGYIGITGQPAIPPRFEDARAFSTSGLAAIKQRGKWGYIDLKGRIVIPPRFEEAGEFAKNGLASVFLHGKCGYINRRGAMVVPPQFHQCFGFGESAPENLAPIRPDNWNEGLINEGLINAKGDLVLRPMPIDADEPHKEYWGFSANGLKSYADGSSGEKLWGYIDTHGHSVIRPQFRFAGDFADNGLARVINRELKSGYIDAKGAFVIPPDLDCAYDFAPDGLARAMRGGKWGFIDASGKMVIRSQYLPVTDFSPSGYAQISDVERLPSGGQCWGPYKRGGVVFPEAFVFPEDTRITD